MTTPEDETGLPWRPAAAGLGLGMGLGAVAGVGVALVLSLSSSPAYAGALLALPLLGVLVGAVCGGAAGVAGSVHAATRGRPAHPGLTTMVAVVTASLLGALFSGFSATGWAYAAALATPFAVVGGLTLPRVAARLGGRPGPAPAGDDLVSPAGRPPRR